MTVRANTDYLVDIKIEAERINCPVTYSKQLRTGRYAVTERATVEEAVADALDKLAADLRRGSS